LTGPDEVPRLVCSTIEHGPAHSDSSATEGSDSVMLRWYLIYTKPASEALALKHLARQHYDVYLPRVVQTVRRAGRCHEQVVALFPRYVFLRLSEGEQSLAPVASTVGVAAIVRFGSCYTVVPDQVIQDLQARADPVTGLHRLHRAAKLTPGAAVRIRLGPFSGLEGVFERDAGAERVVVLLRVLGQSAPVCIAADSILLRRAV